jgi:Lsr2
MIGTPPANLSQGELFHNGVVALRCGTDKTSTTIFWSVSLHGAGFEPSDNRLYRESRVGPHYWRAIMAERMVRQLFDDLDGAEISDGTGEQIEFGVRGVTYRIDLSKANVTKFDKALAPFIESATKVGGRARRARPARRRAAARSPKQELSAVRAWAKKNGHTVSARGRISGDVMKAYEAAHRR